MDVSIRAAVGEDADEIAALLNAIIEARVFTTLDTPVAPDELRRVLRGNDPRRIFHVAVDTSDGAVVGFQKAEPLSTDTHALDHVATMGTYVSLGRHRQGIGTKLFEATFAEAAAAGYEKICTFARSDNEAGRRAYAKQGFREVGRAERQVKIDGRYVDEIMIERFL